MEKQESTSELNPRSTQNLVLRQFKPSMEALGVVMSFIGREKPFSEFRVGKLLAAIKYQVATRNHVGLLSGNTLVGYCGWLPITTALGEKWIANKAELVPVPHEAADAVALTIVSVTSREHLLPMIRECRRMQPNRRVFFKRERKNSANKGSVFNRLPQL